MHRSTMRFPIHRRFFLWPGLLLPSVLCLGCGQPAPLTADMPLHLEDHLAAATVVGSKTPENVREPVVWGPEELRSEWKRAYPFELTTESAQVVPTEEALRLVFTEGNRDSDGNLVGGVYDPVLDWLDRYGEAHGFARVASQCNRYPNPQRRAPRHRVRLRDR